MRYFKKHMGSHKEKEIMRLPNGTVVAFDSLDGLSGWYAVHENPAIEAGLVQMINEQRGGITEVSAEEFSAGFIEKKKQGHRLGRIWREEVGKHVTGNTPLNLLGVEAVQAVAAMEEVKSVPISVDERPPTSPSVPPQTPSKPYIPKTVKKGKPKNTP